jgi:hypothetical protein
MTIVALRLTPIAAMDPGGESDSAYLWLPVFLWLPVVLVT